jgi:hypothetical protein
MDAFIVREVIKLGEYLRLGVNVRLLTGALALQDTPGTIARSVYPCRVGIFCPLEVQCVSFGLHWLLWSPFPFILTRFDEIRE